MRVIRPDRAAIFLDFDDTLSDQFKLNAQYVRAAGRLLADRYCGEPEDWSLVVVELLTRLEDEYAARFTHGNCRGYSAWLDGARARAGSFLEAHAITTFGRPVSVDVLAAQSDALRRCDASFDGAREAIAKLQEGGYRLFIASGQDSDYLRSALEGIGIADRFERLFGPDLIDCAKEGTEYFERAFKSAGVPPDSAIVLDNYPEALNWAKRAGARTVQAILPGRHDIGETAGVTAIVASLRDLPDTLRAME